MDGQTAESWNCILSQFSDANIYQSWAYGAIRWGERHLSHLVLRRGGQLVAAAQLRIARLPWLPAGLAYLRWGPLCHRQGTELNPTVIVMMLGQLREEYSQKRGLSLQVIPNAYLGEDRGVAYEEALIRSNLQPETDGSGYRTVMVDLCPTAEVIRKRLNQKWRNQLNGAEKNGLVLEVGDDHKAYREFVRLYQSMWKRKQFKTSVNVDQFARMQKLLAGPMRMQTFLARKDGEFIGALVCSLIGDMAIYLLGATNEKARELKAAYFLHWQAMLWLKEHGARRYDLGGIDPQTNPGGYHFKSGFGGNEIAQLPSHFVSGGALSDVLVRGVAWLRHRRNCSATMVTASR